ncbi:MAG: glutamine synthetase beta-grasp domain-containing protein, partial [Planctomycetota bacterium]
MFASAAEALKFIKDNEIEMVDLKIAALGGQWLHVSIPAQKFTSEIFEQGIGYDGSSGSGFSSIESGDLAAVPDPTTAFLDPFPERRTLSLLCDTVVADTRGPFPHDPRTIAKRAESCLRATGIADRALFGPEFEFHVFDRI